MAFRAGSLRGAAASLVQAAVSGEVETVSKSVSLEVTPAPTTQSDKSGTKRLSKLSKWSPLAQSTQTAIAEKPAEAKSKTAAALEGWLMAPVKKREEEEAAERTAKMTAEVKRRLTVSLQRMSEDMDTEDAFEKHTLKEMGMVQRAYVTNLLETHREAQTVSSRREGHEPSGSCEAGPREERRTHNCRFSHSHPAPLCTDARAADR